MTTSLDRARDLRDEEVARLREDLARAEGLLEETRLLADEEHRRWREVTTALGAAGKTQEEIVERAKDLVAFEDSLGRTLDEVTSVDIKQRVEELLAFEDDVLDVLDANDTEDALERAAALIELEEVHGRDAADLDTLLIAFGSTRYELDMERSRLECRYGAHAARCWTYRAEADNRVDGVLQADESEGNKP